MKDTPFSVFLIASIALLGALAFQASACSDCAARGGTMVRNFWNLPTCVETKR